MEREKIKNILRKLINFCEFLLVVAIIPTSYLIYISMKNNDMSLLIFLILVSVFFVFASLTLELAKRWL